MKTIGKFIAGICVLGAIALFSVGCNTVEGMGEDIERGGEEIQDVAD